MVSILQRLTGAFLAVGLAAWGAWLWIAAYCGETCTVGGTFTDHIVVRLALIAWTFAFYYHLLNGIRHLFWDMGRGLNLGPAARSGEIAIVGSLLLTAASWYNYFV